MPKGKQEKAGENAVSPPNPVRIDTLGRDAIWSERLQSKQTQDVIVMNGEQILWANPLHQDCIVVFERDGCPFGHDHPRCELVVPAKTEKLSDPVRGKVEKSYRFSAGFAKPTSKDGRGTPKIRVQG
jgi:hypothetical protein